MAETKLTKELGRAYRKREAAERSLNMRVLATEAGLPYGWVRSVMSGAIVRPPAAKLVKLAAPLGLQPERLLALTDQLGAVTVTQEPPTDQSALIAVLTRQAKATERQNELVKVQADAYRALALSIDNAARGVLEKVATFDQALTELVELAGKQALAIDEDGAPVGPAQRS